MTAQREAYFANGFDAFEQVQPVFPLPSFRERISAFVGRVVMRWRPRQRVKADRGHEKFRRTG
jgi:hypothetical protein